MSLIQRLERPATKTLVGVALLSAAAAAVLFFIGQMNGQDSRLYLQNRNYLLQTSLHEMYRTEHADVVMLGNSLTYGVNWNELLGRPSVVNRGIVSDITEGYLHRLEAVVKLKPRLCFLEGGINDIYAGIPVDVVFTHYKEIIRQLKSGGVTPVIQSTLYVSPRWHDYADNNARVSRLNDLLRTFAAGNDVVFVDLNKRMALGNALNDTLTYDGVHLNAAGYRLWALEVEQVLSAHGM